MPNPGDFLSPTQAADRFGVEALTTRKGRVLAYNDIEEDGGVWKVVSCFVGFAFMLTGWEFKRDT